MSESADTLASYGPSIGLSRLVGEDTVPVAPGAARFPAAALFADISGSTALAERLAERGPVGAEALSEILNAYFGQLIEIIAAHGGDVAKFAGDGLLALWPANGADGDLVRLCCQTAQCGMAIQTRLDNYPAGEGIRLSLRVGIGAGDAFIAAVGGVSDHWEFLIAGAPVVQACAAEAAARPGDVVLSPEAWAVVRGACAGEPLETGAVRLASITSPWPVEPIHPQPVRCGPPGRLRAFAPRAVLARLAAGQSDWLAELRLVTVFFINLPDWDCTADLECTQEVMRTIQSILYRYEGSVLRLGADQNGPIVLAGFGLPPLAHEDDARRAVRAALSIHATLRSLGLRSAIGIATGRAFCGSVGNAWRREYTMVADVVNLAARLMQGAGDDILCDVFTHQACSAYLSFDSLPVRCVRGKTEPVAVYRPYGETRKTARRQTVLIGRERERAFLAEQLQTRLGGSPGGAVLIEGEAGIGKSRLVDDLRQQAERLGVSCLTGAGDAIETSTPYYAWRPIIAALLKLDAAPQDLGARREQVLAHIGAAGAPTDAERPALLQLAPLLNAVLPLDLPENELTAQMVGEVRADNTHELLVRLLQEATQSAPLLLIMEDAHWLDSASWALTRRVSQRVPGVLLVVATRPLPDPPPAEYRELLHTFGTHWLWLDTLAAHDTVALVCERLGVTTVPEPVATFICEKAGGQPFFSEELAYNLRDSGRIIVTNGECRIAPGTGDLRALGFPDTVQGVITSRIDRLTPRQQLLLKVASVIGRDFALRTARDVYPIENDKPLLMDDLDALVQLDLVHVVAAQPDHNYRFKHIITREVAYNLMPFAQRQQLHRTVGEWYERAGAADPSPFFPLLAHHWRNALSDSEPDPQLASKAIDYLESAGEQALGSYANAEAVHFFTEALSVYARYRGQGNANGNGTIPPLRQARWERQLGEACYGLGKAMEAREHFERALAPLGYPVPSIRRQFVSSLAGQIGRQVLHRMTPRALAGRAPADRCPALSEASRAYEQLSLLLYVAMEGLPSIHANLRALNLAEAAGPSPGLARCYANVASMVGIFSQPRLADAYFRKAHAVAGVVDEPSALARVWFVQGYYCSGMGQWRRAQEAFNAAFQIYDHLGDRRRWEESLMQLAIVSYNRSDFADSLRLYTDGCRSASHRGDTQAQAWAMIGQTNNLMVLGQVDQALATLQAAEALLSSGFGSLSDRAAEINGYGMMALGYARRDEEPRALEAAESAVRLIEQSPLFTFYALMGYTSVAEALLTLWQNRPNGGSVGGEGLQRLASRACAGLRNFSRLYPIGRPQAYLWQGLYSWLVGKPSKARAAWRAGLAAADRLQMPFEGALAHYEIGRHLAIDDPARQTHLARASDTFTQLGARYSCGRAQAALAEDQRASANR